MQIWSFQKLVLCRALDYAKLKLYVAIQYNLNLTIRLRVMPLGKRILTELLTLKSSFLIFKRWTTWSSAQICVRSPVKFCCDDMESYILIAISGKLTKISNLECVARTLTRLCLCNQQINTMEGLQLPNLQQLLLHQNNITEIKGLEGYESIFICN